MEPVSQSILTMEQAQTQGQETQNQTNNVNQSNQSNQPADMSNLSTIVQEWRRIQDEISQLKEQAREKSKRVKILETIIMNIMKQNNIGALDLKSSNSRILYKKKASKETLAPKTLQKLLTEHFKDETSASEAIKYIIEHRKTSLKDGLQYEKL